MISDLWSILDRNGRTTFESKIDLLESNFFWPNARTDDGRNQPSLGEIYENPRLTMTNWLFGSIP